MNFSFHWASIRALRRARTMSLVARHSCFAFVWADQDQLQCVNAWFLRGWDLFCKIFILTHHLLGFLTFFYFIHYSLMPSRSHKCFDCATYIQSSIQAPTHEQLPPQLQLHTQVRKRTLWCADCALITVLEFSFITPWCSLPSLPHFWPPPPGK